MGAFDDLIPNSQSSTSGAFDDLIPQAPKQNSGIVGDIGTALKRGVLQMPGMATGLADIAAAPVSIATGINRPVSRAADWIGEQTGFQPGKWAEDANAEYSPAMQQAQQNVEQAKGFFPTLGAVAQNPRVAAQVVAESLPSTIAGGLVARGAMGAVAGAEKLTALRAAAGSADAAVANAARRELLKSGAIAAGIGEGAITAGQQMAQTGYDVDPALAAGTALGAGIGTGVIGGLSGRVAGSALGRRLGLSDIETSMAAGTLGENASKAGIAGAVKRIGAGVVQEGLLEEAPQSYQEQVWQNIAAGKPWSEGAAEAAALGAVAGGVMGGAVNAIPRSAQPAEQPPAVQPIAQELAAAARIPDPQVDPVAAINHPASGAIVKATAEGVLSGAIPPNTPATPATPAAPPTAAVVAPPPQGLVAGVPITETTPAAPGSDAPVSTAATSPQTNQVEPAGVPTTGPTADASDQAQIAVPPAQGSEAQPAAGAVAGRVRQSRQERLLQDAEIEAVTGRVEAARKRQAQSVRSGILNGIELTTAGNTIRRFGAALSAAGITNNRVTPEERDLIARRIAARDTLSPIEQEPVNELALPERSPKVAQPSMPRIDALLMKAKQPGVRLVGDKLIDRNGKRLASVTPNEAGVLLKNGAKPDSEWSQFAGNEAQDLAARRAPAKPAVRQGIASAAIPPLQYPQQTASIAGPLPQTATAMPVGRFGAPVQQPKKTAQKFVQPPLTARAQPSETSVLPQTAAQMPVGKFGERANGVEAPKPQDQTITNFIASRTPAQLAYIAANGKPGYREAAKARMASDGAKAVDAKAPTKPVDEIAKTIHSSIADEVIKRAKKHSTPDRAAELESFWRNEKPSGHATEMAQAIADKNPIPLLRVLVGAYSMNQGTARAFERLTGYSLRGNSESRTKAIFDWAGWSEQQVADHVAEKRKAMESSANKRAEARDRANADDMKSRKYRTPDGGEISAADIIDDRIRQGFTEIREGKQGAAKTWTQANPETRSGYRLRDKREADYLAYRISQMKLAGPEVPPNVSADISPDISPDEDLKAARRAKVEALRQRYMAAKPDTAGQAARVATAGGKLAETAKAAVEGGRAKLHELQSRLEAAKSTPVAEPAAKEPWQMSYNEYLNTFDAEGREWEGLRATEHRASVQKAVNEGLMSADAASGEYPDIANEKRRIGAPDRLARIVGKSRGVTDAEIDNSGNNLIKRLSGELKKLFGGKKMTLKEIGSLMDFFGDILGPFELRMQIGPDYNPRGQVEYFGTIRNEVAAVIENVYRDVLAAPAPTTTPVVERETTPDAPQDPKKVEASNDFNAMFDDIMAEIAPQAEGPAPAQTKTPSPRGPVSRETVALRDARQAGRMAFRNQAPATLPTGYAGASQAIKDAWFSGWKSAESDSASWRNRIEQPSLPTRTAGEAAASAAKNVAGGFGDITDALGALFGTKSGGRLSMGLSFDEDTYAKALPLFKSAVSKFQAAGQDLRELMKALMLDVQRKFGNDTLRNMQPYVVRFMEDVKAGSVTIGEAKGGSKDATQTTGTTGGESLPGVPAKSVQKDDAGANDGDIRPEQGGGGAGSDGGTARPGVPAVGGVGGGKGRSVPGRGRPKRGADGNGGDIPATPPNQPDPVKSGLTDYVITSETLLGEGGAKTKFKNNIAAIRLINELDDSARPVTREDQDVLARYVGWGMLPQAFDAKNGDWSKEYSELKGLLTEEEWNEAYMSTQYAHYTSEEIITNGVYAALDRLGFSGGKILEPGSGVGNFVGLMPQSLRTAGSRVTGIERERISAKIGQYLYPTHNMLQADFTEFKAPDGYFDAAIGNPPFSATALTDASGRKHLSGLSVHNYFFAKSVDQLRPGGVFAMVVSNSFLDAQKDSARRYIGERTKFLGAIRLPNNAFKKNAGTDVTTDLIFLQKLKESDVASKATKEAAKSWMETSQIPDPLGGENIPLNDYYIAHPEMMLGRMERSGKMYRAASAALVANEGSDITTQLREAVALLPANVYVAPSLSSTDKALDSAVVALEDDTVQPGGMYTKDGDLYVRLQDEAGEKLARKLTADYQWTEKTVLGENRLERLKAIAELRSTVRNLLAAEIKDDAKAMKQLRSQLNTQYDAIVSKWDFLSSSGTVQLIGDDPDYPLLAALETDYDKGITAYAAKKNGIAPVKPSAKKMAIFTQRVIPKHEEVTKAETPVDALMVSIFERGHIDQQYISSLLGGRDGKEVIDELVEQGHLFFDPESDRHVLKDEYLSGDVRRKLKIAQASGLNANARALEKVIPEDVPSHNIIGTMGASWISNEIYQDFINEQLGEGTVSRVKYSPAAGSFVVEINAGSDFINTNTLGINMDGGRAADLIEKILNKKQAKIGHYEDGKFILDKESTDKAADKITEIKTRFGDWLFKDADRSEVLTRAYNDTVNNYVVREFDGSMLTFPGKVPDSIIKFRRHQRNAIARILQSGQALLDHVVGAGKTFTVIAAAMEMRRTGIAHKPMVTVPNHLVKQWASDFYRLYPGAKVLAATKNDFARENRRAFLAKIATGDWDAVIIAHSTFGFIQPEKQFEIEFNGAQIKDITDAINELGGEVGDKGDARDKGTKRTVKQLAKMREKLQERIKALRQKPMDNLLDLAELGIDALFVDEAHKFKNLMYTTKMQGVRVGGDPSGSQRAYDMYIKTQQVMKKSGGRGVVFATGTPISNTMAEMYHVLRYLAPKTLTDMGLKTFDAWADAFASAETFWMQSMSGDGYKASTRLEKFINVPSLLRIYDQVADTVTMEDIKDAYRSENKGKEFPIPPVKGGGARSAVSIKRSQAQTEYMQEIASRAKALEQRKGPPQKGQDNMLSIMGDARKAAMDMRLVDKSITERDPNGRIAVAAENVWERYKQYNSVKGTQLIFSDMGTPKKSAAKEMEEYNQLKARADRADDSALQDRATLGDEDAIAAIEDAEEAAAEIEKKGKDWADAIQAAIRGFSIYDDMKEALMEKGIPENEIAFIHSYNTDDQKAALFKAVNSGVIRVLLGSTEKMGAGTNVQERVVALHHLDVPWRPSDVEQREGRVVRQGNKLLGLIKGFEVEIMAYATQDTLDLYMWQTQENKLKMIGQLRTGNVDFEMDNAFEEMAFSAGEMQAAATSNPYLLDEIRVKDQIKKLERKKRSYEGQRNDIINRSAKAKRDVSVLPAEIQTAADIADGERGYRSKLDADNKALTISVNGTDVTGIDNIRKATGAALDAMRDIVVVTVGGTDFKVRSLDQLQDAIKASQKKGDINRIAFDGKEYDLNVWGGVVSNGADAIDAALDKTVSEKIKASGFELGGKEYKSYSSLMDGLRTLIGDREPIKFSVAGQDIIQRSKIKSAVSEALAKAVDGESRELLGKFGDVQVYVEAIPDRKDKSKIILNAQVEYNGSGMNGDVLPAGVWDAAVEPSLAKLMGERVIDKARQIMLNASSNEQSARERLAQARRTLADIESNKIDDEWPGEQELKAARAKHDKVLRQLSGRANKQEPKGPVDDLAAKAERMPPIDDRLYNVAATAAPSPSDSAVYQMAQEGKPASEILAFLAKASRRPFNRVLAVALQKAGLQTSITVDSQGGWSVGNRSYAPKYAAAYSPKADKVALFTPRDAERHVLHELAHAATLKAINAGGAASMRMTALFKHVEKSGKLEGMYGMSTLDEFVAEVFSNPKFRAALESVPAPAGSTLKTAWDWFVRIVARVLGFQSNGPHTALDRALRDGVALMDENAAIRAQAAGGDDRYAIASDRLKATRLFHSTANEDAAKQILADGIIKPPELKNSRGKLTPVVGRSYASKSLETAGIYSLGGVWMGREHGPERWTGRSAGRYGYVFEVDSAGLGDVQPDEDIVGELAARAIERKVDGLYWLASLAKRHGTERQLRNAIDGYYADQAQLGKKLLKYMTDDQKITLLDDYGAHVANDGPMRVVRAWKIDKSRSKEIARDGSNLLDIGEQVYGEKLDAIRAADEAVRFNAADDLPPTITVDGVERPTTNSNGRPIHPTLEGVRNFWRWFGGSKVVDADGRPLVVYHGTSENFSRFNLNKLGSNTIGEASSPELEQSSRVGHWFSSSPTGQTPEKYGGGYLLDMPSYIRAESPMILGRLDDLEYMLKDGKKGSVLRREMQKSGQDAIVIERDSEFKGTSYIVFSGQQIKSATGNLGTFSPDDPDIRYNLAANWPTSALPQAKALRDTVATALRSDANTSWITPFNTQYHKAEKWAADGKPLFKRVFNLVQQFLGDVSKYAVMAQNAAPTLLHEWRTISDVKAALSGGDLVGRKHRADIAAVAMPLYDGTLYGGGNPLSGIKWSDERLRTKYKLTDRQIKLYHEALAAVNVSMDEMAKSVIAQHAKREKVGFDSGMDIDDMSAGVLSNLEDKKQEIMESVGEIAQETVNAQIADLKEMDRPDEADKLKREFDKAKKDAKADLERIDKTIGDINGIVAKNKALQAAGYFPLMRFGKHTVTARDKDGKVQFFGMYDGIPLVPGSGQAEANRVAAQLKEEFPDWDVKTDIVNDQKYKLYQGVNLDALQLFAEHMEKDDVEPFQEFVRMATNNRSAQRRLLHRKGTPGFDKDVRRTMAQFITSNARATSSNYHTQDMLRAAAEAEKDGGDIGAEAIKLVKYVQDPIEEAQALRGFLFFNFLGGSIASAMVNLTQTPAMTLPYLSKFEQAPALMRRTMAAARMAAGKPENIADQKLRDALMRAELDGVTAPQEIHQLMATAANNIFAGSRAANILLRGWGAPFAMAESFNRRIAFITAFKIGEGMGNSIKNKTGFDNAFDFAEDVVKQTQGIYNKGNRMNIGRGAVGATLLTFKQYSVMYLELLKRLPPKQRAIMVGVLLLSAGAGGLPGVDDLEDLWDTVGQWLGYATNSKRSIRNSLTEFAGAPIADVVLNGVLSRMGIDLHSRLGMQNLIPGTGILKQSSTDKGRDIEEFFGPAASVIKSAGDALENMATGRPGKAAMAVSPVAIRNAALGGKMAATGFAQDARGRNTVPVNEVEAFAKGIGFNPKSVAEFGSVKRDLAQDQRLVGVKREEFAAAMADAILNNDPEARLQAIKDLQEWNQNNPFHRVTITPESIAKRVRDARAEGATRMLRSLPKGMRTQAAEEFRQ